MSEPSVAVGEAEELAFVNGRVHLLDAAGSVAEAIAVRRGRIVAAGSNAEVRAQVRRAPIDLRGRSLLPGFIDAHAHFASYGAAQFEIDCKAPGMQSIGAIQAAVRARAATSPPGSWIRARGYDQLRLAERRHPNRFDLDAVAPDHPVLLSRTCGHIAAGNSRALALAGVSDRTPDPSGGLWERDAQGRNLGVASDEAQGVLMAAAALGEPEMRRAVERANADFLAAGVTSVHSAGALVGPEWGALQAALDAGLLNVRLYMMVWIALGIDEGSTFLAAGPRTGFGNDRLRLGPFKVMVDGSSSGPTCATREPYTSDPSGSNRGILYWTQDELSARLFEAHRKGWQTTLHAMGDRAIELGLNAHAYTRGRDGRADPRQRLEHCGLCPADLQVRVVNGGVIPVMQPHFLREFGDGYLENYGEGRVASMFPARSLLAHGVPVCGSSDAPVSDHRPLRGMQAAIQRLTRDGRSCGEAERVSLDQALRMYTANPAFAEFAEHEKGRLQPGALADLVVLGADLARVPVDEIGDVPVDLVFSAGRLVSGSY